MYVKQNKLHQSNNAFQHTLNPVDEEGTQRLIKVIKVHNAQKDCHGEYGPTLNWSGGTIYGSQKLSGTSQKWSGTIFGCRKWSPRTNYGCHKRSPPAITGPGRTIRGNKIIVKKKVRDHFWQPSNTAIKECISNL